MSMDAPKSANNERISPEVEQVAKDALSKIEKETWGDFLHTVEVLIAMGRAEYEIEMAKKQNAESEK